MKHMSSHTAEEHFADVYHMALREPVRIGEVVMLPLEEFRRLKGVRRELTQEEMMRSAMD